MSDIKMCDSCGSIFSVNSENWDSYTKSTTRRVPDVDRPVVTSQMTFHTCGECNTESVPVTKPRLRDDLNSALMLEAAKIVAANKGNAGEAEG